MNDNPETIRITVLGDALFDDVMSRDLEKYQNSDGDGYDFTNVFRPLQDFLNKSDYVLANLETPISKQKENFTNQQYQFCTSASYAKAMKDCGVDYVSTANNHCMDRGLEGLADTVNCLDEIGLDHNGTYVPGEAKKPLIVNIGGIRIGLLSYTYGTNAVTNKNYLPFKFRKSVDLLQEQEGSLFPYDPLVRYILHRPGGRVSHFRDRLHCHFWPQNRGKIWVEWRTWDLYRKSLIKKDIQNLRKLGADKILISLHIGGQYNLEPNEYTLEMTRWLEQQGVEYIIANHEHVIHGCKYDSKNLTTYAIGNLLGSEGTKSDPMDRNADYSVAVHLYLDKYSKETKKVTFSILKSYVAEDGTYQVWPSYNLVKTLDSATRNHIEHQVLECARVFSGKEYKCVEEEFRL